MTKHQTPLQIIPGINIEHKNPLSYPENIPYAFTQKFIRLFYTIGILSFMSLSSILGQAQNTPVKILQNTFLLKYVNLPYVPIPFGTKNPLRLSRQEAVAAINRAFEKEQLFVESKMIIERRNLKIQANAYSAQYKIGYIFIDFQNMGDDFTKQKPPLKNKFLINTPKINEERIINKHFDLLKTNKTKYIKRNCNNFEKNKAKAKYKENLELFLTKSKTNKKEFKKLYIEFQIERWVQTMDNKDLKTLIRNFTNKRNMSVSSLIWIQKSIFLDRHLRNYDKLSKILKSKINSLIKIENTSQQWKSFRNLVKLIDFASQDYALIKISEFEKELIIILEKDTDFTFHSAEKRLKKFLELQIISYQEAKILEIRAKKNREFIAPIFSIDDRLIYKKQFFIWLTSQEKIDWELEYEKLMGLTPEIKKKREQEIEAINLKYRPQNDSITNERKKAIKDHENSFFKEEASKEEKKKQKEEYFAIKAKYSKISSDLTKKILNELRTLDKLHASQESIDPEVLKKHLAKRMTLMKKFHEKEYLINEKIKQNTLLRLENDVRQYIQWAKSQQGY